MEKIKCPNCGENFFIDESGYSQIVKQVRDIEFEKELNERKRELNLLKERDLEIVKLEEQKKFDKLISEKQEKIEKLEIKIKENSIEQELFISKALQEQEIKLQDKINSIKDVNEKILIENNDKNLLIERLKAEIKNAENIRKIEINEAIDKKNKEISYISGELAVIKEKLKNKDVEMQLKEKAIEDKYIENLKLKDEQIQYYKDFKLKQSTKLVGESLEQHCMNEFNSIRMAAFPNAYFEKDNNIKSGSKGDFIFREDIDGIELVSIMFEMKNEMDTTATKHKNEDFFKELDKDRREKNCEYAVLVSMLESDNEYYNNGIVDVSYKFDKMYVIRPQFFIPIITLLRNAALNSLKYKKELEYAKNQQIDILNFENKMNEFKEGFSRNYRLASEKFQKAIDEIDKTILHLQKTKEALLSSENNLRLANNKAEDLSVKKLSKDSPTIKNIYEEIKTSKL